MKANAPISGPPPSSAAAPPSAAHPPGPGAGRAGASPPDPERPPSPDIGPDIFAEAADLLGEHILDEPSKPAMRGPSTRAIALRLDTDAAVLQMVDDLAARAAPFLPGSDVISFAPGDPVGGPSLGEVARAFVIDRYQDKYGIVIGMAASDFEDHPPMTSGQVDRIAPALAVGQAVGLLIDECLGLHSSPLVLKHDGARLHVLALESLSRSAEFETDTARTLSPLCTALGGDLRFTAPAGGPRQADYVSCHTDALVMMKDVLTRHPDLPETHAPGAPLPSDLLRSAQISAYRAANAFAPDTIYAPAKSRSVGDHLRAHQVAVHPPDGSAALTVNRFLAAKTIQYAEATVQWLESFRSEDEARAALDDLRGRLCP